MDIVKTRDSQAVDEAARIWAQATAKRDDSQASDAAVSQTAQLIRDVLDASERSFLLTLSEAEHGMLSFAAIGPQRDVNDPAKAELRFLGVAPGHWGEGWARRLLVALPDALREEDFSQAMLWVYADNTRAIFVYESLAWVATGETRPHPVTGRVEQEFRRSL